MDDFLSFRLPQSFLDQYKSKKPNWGFDIGGGNSLAELTYISKYSRLKDDGSKEQWWETCARCVEGMYSILKDWCKQNRTPWNEFKAQRSAQEAYDMMFAFKWTPPGRGLANMGTRMVHEEQNNASLNNCFAGSETFLTAEYGVVRFDEVAGEEVTVLTTDGWEKAVVKAFGTQPVQRVTFKPFKSASNVRHTVIATPDHRWVLRNGTVTTDLKVGDYVKGHVAHYGDFSYNDDYWDGLLHGVVFGDGTKHPHVYTNGDLRFQLRACDDRVTQTILLPEIKSRLNTLFQQNGNYHASIRTTTDLKQFPTKHTSSYIRGFIEGWITADGSPSTKDDTYVLASQRLDARSWLEKWAAFGGFTLVGANFDPVKETNFGVRSNPVQRLSLRDGASDWTVVSIEPLSEEMPVYCAVVPQASSFTLSSGIYTGNCAFISTEKLSTHSAYEATMPFVRLMEMSMHGVGVGFDTRGAGKLMIHQPVESETWTYQIGDSREEWAKSIGLLLESYFFKNRPAVNFDYSLIRPAGAPLKRFGGTASGPEPLRKVHEGIRKIFKGRQGDKITSRDIVDIMNMIGKAVVAGGARRSALIALGEAWDLDYVNLKNWELPENKERTGPDGWAWTSNNSVFANEDADLTHLIDKIAVNGEPGVIYLDVMQKYGRLADPPTNKDYRAIGVNPCVTADTWVLTAHGPRQVKDLIGVPHKAVVDGKEYNATGFFYTGDKEVYSVKFADGRILRLTDNHQLLKDNGEWVEVGDLNVGDRIRLHRHTGYEWFGPGTREEGYLIGHLIGDGTFYPDGSAALAVWEQDEGSDVCADYIFDIVAGLGARSDFKGWHKSSNQRRIKTTALAGLAAKFGVVRGMKTITPSVEEASSDFTAGVLSGLFDTDGSVQGTQLKGVSVRLANADLDMLRAAQRMLGRLGINSKIYFRRDERVTKLPDGNGGYAEYVCKPQWELIIANDNLARFAERVGFVNPRKQTRLEEALSSYKRELNQDKFHSEIVSIDYEGIEPVYDVTVDEVHCFDANGLYAHNCAEISLEPHEFCCLVELYPANIESFSEFERAIKHAYMYAKAVTLMPSVWAETNEVITRNRRIGVSMTGIVEFIETRSWGEMKKWMNDGYRKLRELDQKYSEWLGVRESIKVSTVKPAGTTSLIAGTTSGVHWPTTSGYYIRRQRFLKHDPIVKAIEAAGYHVEPDIMDPDQTVVAEFPTKGLNVRSEREVSIWEKAHLAAMAQRYWADNMVSVTVSFDSKNEGQEIGPLLRSLEGQLKSISFLPISSEGTTYAQAPLEPLAEEIANQKMQNVKRLNMKALYGKGGLEAEGEKFCTTDVCELTF